MGSHVVVVVANALGGFAAAERSSQTVSFTSPFHKRPLPRRSQNARLVAAIQLRTILSWSRVPVLEALQLFMTKAGPDGCVHHSQICRVSTDLDRAALRHSQTNCYAWQPLIRHSALLRPNSPRVGEHATIECYIYYTVYNMRIPSLLMLRQSTRILFVACLAPMPVSTRLWESDIDRDWYSLWLVAA